MAVGRHVLRTLEARWPRCPDRILRADYNRWFFAALSALSSLGRERAPPWSEAALGRRRDCPWCSGRRPLMGRAAADVHFYLGQPSSMAARTWRASPPPSAVDTPAISPLAEPARRIRPRPHAAAGLRRGPAHGERPRQHTLAPDAANCPASPAAPSGLSGARASQSQRRPPLSLSVRYSALVRHAVAHRRVALTRFSCRDVSPTPAGMAAAPDRAGQFPLAAQGPCDRAPGPCFRRRSGRRPPHSNFRSAGDTGDRRGSPVVSVLGGFRTAPRLRALPAIFQRSRRRSDRHIRSAEVGESSSEPGWPRGRTLSPKSGSVPVRRQPTKSSA